MNAMSDAGPPQGANDSLSEGRREAPREHVSDAGPPQGAKRQGSIDD